MTEKGQIYFFYSKTDLAGRARVMKINLSPFSGAIKLLSCRSLH